MDLWMIIKVVVRRWYVVLPVLVITAILGYQFAFNAPPTYRANGSALLVAPANTTELPGATATQNPYLLFSGSLNITASSVVRVLSDATTRDALFEAGLLPDYEIGVEPSIPAIGMTATGRDPDVVVATVKHLLGRIAEETNRLQDAEGAPGDVRISVRNLVDPDAAILERGDAGRVIAVVGALGLALAVGLALAIESLVAYRRSAVHSAGGMATGVVPPVFLGPQLPATGQVPRRPLPALTPPPGAPATDPGQSPDGQFTDAPAQRPAAPGPPVPAAPPAAAPAATPAPTPPVGGHLRAVGGSDAPDEDDRPVHAGAAPGPPDEDADIERAGLAAVGGGEIPFPQKAHPFARHQADHDR